MSAIQISSPFLRKFTHIDAVANLAISTVLAAPDLGIRRIIVIVQNKSAQNIEIMFDQSATNGILVLPNQLISVDNYCGYVRVKSATSNGASIHIAYSEV